MKVLGFCLLAFVAAAQARSTGVRSTALSTAENPWLVHLRIAVSSSGLLNSCAGSLIDNRWVLTAASCVKDARFVWIRYGAANVINPELVTETSTVSVNDDIALISINRAVELTPTINTVALAASDDEVPASGTFCAYGAGEDNTPGEQLSCSAWNLSTLEDGSIEGVSEEAKATQFDVGAPLVSDGVQVGVLVRPSTDEANAVFVNPAKYRDWIESETAASLR